MLRSKISHIFCTKHLNQPFTREFAMSTTSPFRRSLTLLAIASALALSSAAQSQTDPVKLIVGFPPWGAVDVIARLMVDKLSASSGVPVIVENKPSAGEPIAADLVKNAAPDGNTVMIMPMGPMIIAPLAFSKLKYSPNVDFAPVAHLGKFHLMLAVGGNSPHRNITDMVQAFKANPKGANYGTSAAGSQLHFLGVMLGQATGIDRQHVPHQGGAPLMNDLKGGQVPAAIDTIAVDLHRVGKIRILATSGDNRSSFASDVPTFKEQGYLNVVGEGWYGAYVPKATPAAAVAKISAAMVAAMRAADIKSKMDLIGAEATGLNASEFATIIAADQARCKPLVEASGFNGG
jgi:tripartite-type tricarboxylate transporter receptor subunit TctC